jgi:hypothetical protein
MTSKLAWGYVLLIVGLILDMGLGLVLWIAMTDSHRDPEGIRFIMMFMMPGLAMMAGGVYFLRKARRNP